MNLFDTQPLSRTTDPATSSEAATLMVATGAAKAHAAIVLAEIRRGPGRTAGELANHCPFNSVEVTRRISGLRKAGLITSRDARVCRIRGNKMQTHWPTRYTINTNGCK